MQGENDGGVGGGVGFRSPLPLLLLRYEKIGAFFFGIFLFGICLMGLRNGML